MDVSRRLEQLYQCAVRHQFEEFDTLFTALKTAFTAEDLWEAYAMRAQIKLFTADPTLLDDLIIAGPAERRPRFPCLNSQWKADAPNRFILFSKAPGRLDLFVQAVSQARETMARLYGGQGQVVIRQLQCELAYFQGEIHTALTLAEEQAHAQDRTHTDVALSKCLQFRCNLALGRSQRAEECMLDLIRLSKAYPECAAPYQSLRGWANLTTSWNGDSPRFYTDETGQKLPVLEARLEDIRLGGARTTPLEMPFIRYAERSYEGVYPLRQYYMDLFHAMYWFSVGDDRQMDFYFRQIYDSCTASGLIFPLIECGEQLTPLLRHIQRSHMDYPTAWLDGLIAGALQYEESLYAYRKFDV